MFSLKFVKRYNKRNCKAQPETPYIHKAATSSAKLSRHQNINDTDSSSDDEDYRQVTNKGDAYLDEWSLHLNTMKLYLMM